MFTVYNCLQLFTYSLPIWKSRLLKDVLKAPNGWLQIKFSQSLHMLLKHVLHLLTESVASDQRFRSASVVQIDFKLAIRVRICGHFLDKEKPVSSVHQQNTKVTAHWWVDRLKMSLACQNKAAASFAHNWNCQLRHTFATASASIGLINKANSEHRAASQEMWLNLIQLDSTVFIFSW